MKSKDVAVIGAGITGLTAAYRLSELGHNVEVFEASNRVGGSIKTESVGSAHVDIGPSGVLASRQSVVDLVRDLGLDSEWLSASPASNRRYIFYKGKLNEVPTSPPKLLTSSWIPLSAKWRFVTEFFRPTRRASEPESLHALIDRRLGSFVADVMVDAMVSGVHAAPAKSLEALAAFPVLPTLEREHGSLLRGLIHLQKSRRKALPQHATTLKGMLNLRGGLETLPKAMEARLDKVHLQTPVHAINSLQNNTWRVEHQAGVSEFDEVILCIPAPHAARCISGENPELANLLQRVEYTPLGNVILHYDEEIETPPGFGYLSPGIEARPILGCLFLNQIFPELIPASTTVLRAFVGGQRAAEQLELDDESLVKVVTDELEFVLDKKLPRPQHVQVLRWPTSLAFYQPGTSRQWKEVEDLVGGLPGLHLGGNWIGGASVAECITRANTLVSRITSSTEA